MIPQKYSPIIEQMHADYGVPENFFSAAADDNTCIFLVSCLNQEKILYLEDSFEKLTGYPPTLLTEKGLSVWFSLIHPEDIPLLSHSIIKSHELLASPGFTRPFPPLVLEYRFKLASNIWKKIRETKHLLLRDGEVAIDKVLCKLEFIESDKDESCSRLLDFAIAYKDKNPHNTFGKPNVPALTEREIEILRLIGKGLSTKQIADKCYISVNTVETHRRHLLEKLNVKNSMELIKEASRLYSLD